MDAEAGKKANYLWMFALEKEALGNALCKGVVNSASSLCAMALVKLGPLLAKVKEFLWQ